MLRFVPEANSHWADLTAEVHDRCESVRGITVTRLLDCEPRCCEQQRLDVDSLLPLIDAEPSDQGKQSLPYSVQGESGDGPGANRSEGAENIGDHPLSLTVLVEDCNGHRVRTLPVVGARHEPAVDPSAFEKLMPKAG